MPPSHPHDIIDGRRVRPTIVTEDFTLDGIHNGTIIVEAGTTTIRGVLIFGIPTEGVVASNHAKGFMGPRSFKDAKFSFPGAATELHLRMGY
jgi:hypothetical protein